MKNILMSITLLSLLSCWNNSETISETDNSFKIDTSFSQLYSSSPLYSQPFRVFLDNINSLPEIERQQIALSLLNEQHTIPLIESDTIVHFFYWGKASSVAVAGDATGWSPLLKMKNITGTKLWFATVTYPSSTRIEYKIVVNETTWQLDSLNKQVIMGGMGENSELILPDYTNPLLISKNDSAAQGTFFDTIIVSNYLQEKRKIRIYLPPGYEIGTERYPVIMFHDGIQFFDMTSSFNILNNLISEKRMQPLIAVFLEPVNRDAEYSGDLQEKYTLYVTEELIPYLDSAYSTIPDANYRAQAGISNGGNIALWILATHPELIKKAAALSSNVEDNIIHEFEKPDLSDLQIYLLLGKYDLPVLIPKVNKLENAIKKTNCQLFYKEYPEGHNWAFWQKYLPEALEYLFPVEKEK